MSDGRLAALLAAIAVVGFLAPLGATAAVAQEQTGGELTRGEPDLELVDANPEVTPGTETTLEVQIKNDGDLHTGAQADRVLTARGVTAEIDDAGPFEAAGGEVAVGPIQDGAIATAPLAIEVPEDVESGTHEIEVDVEYAYTNRVSDASSSQQRLEKSETLDLRVTVPEEPRFDVSTVAADVAPGSSGDVTMEIENTGGEPANHTRVSVAGFGGVTIGGGTSENAIGDLAPNESTTTTVEAAIADTASATDKPLEATFTYEDGAGIERTTEPVRTTLAPTAEQSFSIRNVDESLSVGYEGDITGEVVNDGPRNVDDAVLIVEPMSESLFVEDTRYALPELKAGESTEFRYPTDVSGQGDPGARQLRFTVEYTGSGDATLTDGPISERVVVDERRDEFSIADDGLSVSQGDSSDAVLEITNERPTTLSNIDARLYADDPLDAPDDEAFVDELEPGESAEIRFEIEATEDATVETHPVELDFEYETERGESVLSDTYQHPIEVTASEDDGGGTPSVVVGILVALAVSTIGVALWYRQD
ncbi:hypothetical protein A6E15_04730 [Natrinema saccharevitans]|uniref:Sialidase n=1 Tax=Natrinema saccharevitans TaxID=301967 RepID=A0A1S8B0S8_9EURY|nr:NEW3 domain-containing protein [Natrinema saccharevitans]OLZ42630.1 hypothetical protein A6E15_04730 [Natrinema saccharevitans]